MKSETLATIQKHNLPTQPQNKYTAAKELSSLLSITHTHASTLINRMLSKIALTPWQIIGEAGGQVDPKKRKVYLFYFPHLSPPFPALSAIPRTI